MVVNGTTSNGWPFSVVAELVTYCHMDAVGSVRMTTDAAGAVVARYDYLPFGQPWPSDSDPDPRRFAGMERELETGSGNWESLNYAGARYYHSHSGRFTSVDPGHVGMNLLNPQTWNGYAYAGNNPLRCVDPTGTDYLIHGYAVAPGIFEGSLSDLESALKGMGLRHDGNAFNGVILGLDSNHVIAYYQQLGLGPGPGSALPGAPPGRGPGLGGGGGGRAPVPSNVCSSLTPPPGPPGADLAANISVSQKYRVVLAWNPVARAGLFASLVAPGRPWDCKLHGQGLQYEAFGHFHFGATLGAAFGYSDQELLRGAGFAQWAFSSVYQANWDKPWHLTGPYGDDPRDINWVLQVIEYFRNGC